VTITLSDPVNGAFTTVIEVTSDGRDTTETFTTPYLAQGACTVWDPNGSTSCKFA
jgi:hypothetical protein